MLKNGTISCKPCSSHSIPLAEIGPEHWSTLRTASRQARPHDAGMQFDIILYLIHLGYHVLQEDTQRCVPYELTEVPRDIKSDKSNYIWIMERTSVVIRCIARPKAYAP